jgi:hypothetical protein
MTAPPAVAFSHRFYRAALNRFPGGSIQAGLPNDPRLPRTDVLEDKNDHE